jgi:NifU-like protein involved in Fe-S cluster formation
MNKEKLYSPTIQRYAQLTQDVFLLPDDIAVKDGVACGDSITIIGEINEETIEFKIAVEGCLLCQATASLLFEKYNGKNIGQVIEDCGNWLKTLQKSPSIILNFFDIEDLPERSECLLSPIEMFLSFTVDLSKHEVEICEVKDTRKELDCDACVRSSRINWIGQRVAKQAAEPKLLTTDYKTNWLKVSKAFIDGREAELLKSLYAGMTDEDFQFLLKAKTAQMVYANLLNYHVDISEDTRWKNIVYQIHRKHIVQGEIQQLSNYILAQGIQAYFVKGSYNNSLYIGNNVRTHLDYDLICLSEQDAFQLGSYLFQKGYTIFTGVFSLKHVIIDGKDCYSGHYHVQKVVNDQYKLIIDVNFPGFPMGRVEVFQPQTQNNHIIDEDQLIVTLCHVFKHKDVYMKDINDVYLMLKTRQLDFRYVGEVIRKNQLSIYASLLFAYIFKNYDLPDELKQKITTYIELDMSIYEKYHLWPYDAVAVFDIKQTDLNRRLQNSVDKARIYLFPLAIFKHYRELNVTAIQKLTDDGFKLEKLSPCIYQISYAGLSFFFTNMGLFIDLTIDVAQIGRLNARVILERFLKICSFTEIFDVPYAIKTPEVWYY